MNNRQHFLAILEFLKAYQKIWQNEIMLMYPNQLDGHPMEWIQELAQFRDKEDIIEIEKKNVSGLIRNKALLAFYKRIEELCRFPVIPDMEPMPEDKTTFLYTIPKKQHEIRKLAPFVNHFILDKKVKSVVDIGGGIGLLAQNLSKHYDLQVKTLDMNETLQETGRKRYTDRKVEYIQLKVHEDSPELKDHLNTSTLTLGLHTCGSLANDQIKSSFKHQSSLINFGCCYEKLGRNFENQNLSRFAQSRNDKSSFNYFALTLATRAHRKMNDKDYDLKLKVKLYRYAVHILLYDKYGIKELKTLGNSTPKLYDESFGVYVTEQFRRINLPLKHSVQELDTFFSDPKLQETIWQMLAAGLIRNALGRLLEVYILLDRALFLEEQGYASHLYEFFDEELSPRNLGIVASLV